MRNYGGSARFSYRTASPFRRLLRRSEKYPLKKTSKRTKNDLKKAFNVHEKLLKMSPPRQKLCGGLRSNAFQ